MPIVMDRDRRLTGFLRGQTDNVKAPKGFELSNPWRVRIDLILRIQGGSVLTLDSLSRALHERSCKEQQRQARRVPQPHLITFPLCSTCLQLLLELLTATRGPHCYCALFASAFAVNSLLSPEHILRSEAGDVATLHDCETDV